MKSRIIAFILLGLVLFASCSAGSQDTKSGSTESTEPGAIPSASELVRQGFVSPELPRISAEDLKVIYDNRDPLVLVDVRPKDLFDTGYIPGARNIPNDPEAESLNKLLQLPKDRLIVLYCD
jgi:hypothetical protein